MTSLLLSKVHPDSKVGILTNLLEILYALFKNSKKYDKDYFKNKEIEVEVEDGVDVIEN